MIAKHLIVTIIIGHAAAQESLLFASFMRFTGFGTMFQPRHPIEWLLTIPNVPAVLRCAKECNQIRLCRTFDYDRQSCVCRLFEGEFSTGTSLMNGTSVSSRIGYIDYTANLFASFNQTCDQCSNANNRYLQCTNNVCQCLPNTYWDGQMCSNQLFNGSICASSSASCRQDLNLTCSTQTNRCVALQLLGTINEGER